MKPAFRRALPIALLFSCLSLSVAKASTPQQDLLALAVSSGTLTQLAAMRVPEAWVELRAQRDSAAQHVQALRDAAPAAPSGVQYTHRLQRLQQTWQASSAAVDRLLALEQTVTDAGADAERIQDAALQMLLRADELAQQLADSGAEGRLIYVAARQVGLLERMQRRIQDVLQAGPTAVTSADGLRRDFAIVSRTQNALVLGDADIGITKIEAASAHGLATEIHRDVQALAEPIQRLVQAAEALTDAQEQTDTLRMELHVLQGTVVEMHASLR